MVRKYCVIVETYAVTKLSSSCVVEEDGESERQQQAKWGVQPKAVICRGVRDLVSDKDALGLHPPATGHYLRVSLDYSLRWD